MHNGSLGEAPATGFPPEHAQRELTVLTWNVLAHVNTANIQPTQASFGTELETASQRTARHRALIGRLMELQPDVALLQEVDESFMPREWYGIGPLPCGATLDGYVPFRSSNGGTGEVATVLLRSATVEGISTVCVSSGSPNGGAGGVVVHVRPLGATELLAVASVHLPFDKPIDQTALLMAAVSARAPLPQHDASAAAGSPIPRVPMVLGGDFQASPAALKQSAVDSLLLNAGLSRVVTNMPTHMKNDDTIDHLYIAGMHVHGEPAVGSLPPLPHGPWTEGGGHDGSDHAWVCVRLSFM